MKKRQGKGQGIKARKAEQKAKKVRARKRKRAFVLIAELLVFFALLGIGYVITKYDKFQLNSIDGNILINSLSFILIPPQRSFSQAPQE